MLPRTYTCLFEPRNYTAAAGDRFVLAKVLINEFVNIDDFGDFHKKIFIVRDPRDNLISRLLYAIYNQEFITDDSKVRFFIKRLEQKRRNPHSVPVIELLQVFSDLSGDNDMIERFILRHQGGFNFDPLQRSYFVYKYELFVAGQFSSLEKYLGFNLCFNGDVDVFHSRVSRTKGSGDWRNWFTEQDVKYFSSIYHAYLIKFGYDVEWMLSPRPEILPEHSTEYVMRLVREGRAAHAREAKRSPPDK
jgi:hypothetical protein